MTEMSKQPKIISDEAGFQKIATTRLASLLQKLAQPTRDSVLPETATTRYVSFDMQSTAREEVHFAIIAHVLTQSTVDPKKIEVAYILTAPYARLQCYVNEQYEKPTMEFIDGTCSYMDMMRLIAVAEELVALYGQPGPYAIPSNAARILW